MSTITAPVSPPRVTPSRARKVVGSVLLGLPSLVVLAFGGQLLATGWTTERAGGTHHVHDLAWGALEGVLLLGALAVALFARTHRPAVLLQALGIVGALLLTMGLVAEPDPFTLVLAALIVGGVLARSSGGLLVDVRPHRGALLLCGAASLPLAWWSLSAAADQRAGGDEHAELLGYTGVTAYALALAAVLGVSALRQPGWRWPNACACLSAGVVGVAGLLWPQDASSPGTYGGSALLVLAVACAAFALTDRHGSSRARSLVRPATMEEQGR